MQPPSRRSEEITRIFRLHLGNHPSVTFGMEPLDPEGNADAIVPKS